MKKKRALPIQNAVISKLIAVFLLSSVIIFLHGNPIANAQNKFSDLQGHWSKEVVEQMVNQGAISGYPDGTFQPNKTITIAEFSSIISNLLQIPKGNSGEHWASPILNGMMDKGIEIPNNYNDAITRNEAAKLIIQADNIIKNKKNMDTVIDVPDINEVPLEYQNYVKQTYARGYIKGDRQGKFNGSGSLTRAEASAILSNFSLSYGAAPVKPAVQPVKPVAAATQPVPYNHFKTVSVDQSVIQCLQSSTRGKAVGDIYQVDLNKLPIDFGSITLQKVEWVDGAKVGLTGKCIAFTGKINKPHAADINKWDARAFTIVSYFQDGTSGYKCPIVMEDLAAKVNSLKRFKRVSPDGMYAMGEEFTFFIDSLSKNLGKADYLTIQESCKVDGEYHPDCIKIDLRQVK